MFISADTTNQGRKALFNMASSAYTQLTKTDDLEAGPHHEIGEKFELEEKPSSSGSLLSEQSHREGGVSTTAQPEKETGRVSLLFWIVVNTLATIAIVCRPFSVFQHSKPFPLTLESLRPIIRFSQIKLFSRIRLSDTCRLHLLLSILLVRP